MSATTQSAVAIPGAPPVVIRNSRILLGVVMAFGVAGWFLAVCSVLIAIGSFAPFKSISFPAVMAAATWILGAYGMYALGVALWKLGRTSGKNTVVMDASGVHFHYISGKGVADFSFPAGHVSSVSHKRVGNYQTYTVHGSDGATFLFTSYTFFRTKHTAQRIAAFCGVPQIQEEK